jgi:hypothetical protein
MVRSRRVPVCLAIYGAAVLAVPLVVLSHRSDPRAVDPSVAVGDEITVDDAEPLADPLVGLWAEPVGEGQDRVRFYYFHGDGHGLYRYGKRSATFTNSFDYDVVGDTVELRFRKTGAEYAVHFAIESDESGDRLVLAHDPRGDGRGVYVRTRRDPVGHADAAPTLGGRMWFDRTSYATGGYGFALYQLRAAGIDGRGTGWFHRGDFDDWSTESLVYRIVGDRLELVFERSGESHTTHFALEPGDPTVLVLDEDPRDWWHAHRYLDAGPAFGSAPTMLLPPAVTGS